MNDRFESQLSLLKERLEAAKQFSSSGNNTAAGRSAVTNNQGTFGGFNFGNVGGLRIAKPIKGGGGGDADGEKRPSIPFLSGLQGEGGGNKRNSWFFNQRS